MRMGLLTELRSSISRATASLFAGDEPKRIGIYGPPNAGKCLAPDEEILLADGTHKRIDEIYSTVASVGNPTDVSDLPTETWLECSIDISVPALHSDMSISPAKVSHVFRQYYDGILYTIKTRSGRTVTVSPEHPFIASSDDGVTKIPAHKLNENDTVGILGKFQPIQSNGGPYAADGGVESYSVDGLGIADMESAHIPSIDDASKRSYLQRIFDEHAVIYHANDQDSPEIVLGEFDRSIIRNINTILLEFGILAIFDQSTTDKQCSLRIQGPRQCSRFVKEIGFTDNEQQRALTAGVDIYPIDSIQDVQWDTIESIEQQSYEGYIYDLTVPACHTFTTAEGLIVHNTTLANRIARDWTGDAIGPESHIPHETRRARRKENVEIQRNGKSVTIDVVDTPGVTTKVDYKEFLEHDIEKDDAVRRSREATEGVAEAMHWLREDVDGVIYVLDSSEDPFTQVNTMLIGIIESQNLPVLIFANKIDLEDSSVQRIKNAFPQHETIPLSALEGENMDEVYDKIAEYFG